MKHSIETAHENIEENLGARVRYEDAVFQIRASDEDKSTDDEGGWTQKCRETYQSNDCGIGSVIPLMTDKLCSEV